jgi:Zn-dependent peptidase ImmA (M78 family)/transcriptional regulator with XRE-family HTH domain
VPRSATIAVDGRLVKWARESAGLSGAALGKKLGIKNRAKLTAWEAPGARADLTPRQLERLADATKRPLAAFFLKEPPAEPILPDFRRPPGEEPPPLSGASLLAIRRARRMQHVFVELAEELGEGTAARLQGIAPGQGPDVAAARAREVVGVSVDDQTGWKDPDTALKVWRNRLEGLGLLIFQFAMPPDELSGFSLANGMPAIVLNRKDHHSRRVFTLFHEWAHLLRGEAGLCEVAEDESGSQDAEVFCNAFAGSLLVPMDALRESEPFALHAQHRLTVADAAEQGARLFSVSRHVILRRFLSAQAISRETYRRTVGAWQAERRPPRRKAKGGAPPYLMTVSELGARFVSRVLAAHERGLIGDSDLSDYLTLRLKHLDRVQELVAVA